MFSRFVLWGVSSLALTLALPVTAAIEKHVLINGTDLTLQLEPNTRLQDDEASHYQAAVKDFPDSWARLSQIDGQWDGLLVHQGQTYQITAVSDAPLPTVDARTRSLTSAMPRLIDHSVHLGTCGIDHSPITATSLLKSKALDNRFLGATIPDLADYCTETVDGVCLVAELSMFFDQAYRDAFPTDYRSRGAQMMNIVDGIYQEELGIVFRQLQLDFFNGDQFVDTRNPEDILNDMINRRVQGRIRPSDPNTRSLMHLVTGRDFRIGDIDSVAGVANGVLYTQQGADLAFTPVLCGAGAVATSQVVGDRSGPSATLTAIIIAHEIGHNLGMEHDGEAGALTAESCTQTDQVMYFQVVPGASTFSTCSKDAAALNIAALSAVEACFDFPVDFALSAVGGNSTSLGANATDQHDFNLALRTANAISDPVQVSGSIDSGDATFTSVTLAGNNCSLNTDATTYTCSATSVGPVSNLNVSFTTGSEHAGFSHTVTAGTNLLDIDTSDDSVSTTVLVQGTDLPPTTLTASYDKSRSRVTLNWQDHATNETAYQVERSIDGGVWEVINDTLEADSTRFDDNALLPFERHAYRVSALIGGTATAPTNTVEVEVISERMRYLGSPGGGGSLGLPLLMALLVLTACDRLIRNRSGRLNY
ncbi:MAG: zinc-dependent metalloprotease family protein [Gammaproteobacteria bacterium]